jgi:hypothetical protein
VQKLHFLFRWVMLSLSNVVYKGHMYSHNWQWKQHVSEGLTVTGNALLPQFVIINFHDNQRIVATKAVATHYRRQLC